jgi:methylmalonyl-CoA mutase
MKKKNDFLFSEFPPVSAKAWKQKIQADLKGADYHKTLIWNSLDGIAVKPFYHQDFFNQGNATTPMYPKAWGITQAIFIDDIKIATKLANQAITDGAEALLFQADTSFDVLYLASNLKIQNHKIICNFSFIDASFIEKCVSAFSGIKENFIIGIDPIHQLASTGNWFINQQKDFDAYFKTVSYTKTLFVNTALYQNAGATNTQQLAYAMGHLNEYFNFLSENKLEAPAQVIFQVAIGSNYFFEIAKLRALRKLFKTLTEAYNFTTTCRILATPSKRNKTLYDYNLNMLRTTTECMSAILGGADLVCNMPYDVLFHKSNYFGERIARNQLLILKEESYFKFDKNPTEGAYYIESLQQQMAENALLILKEIEKGGGFINQLMKGKIQKKIQESAHKEQTLFDADTLILVGTNKYQNINDKMNHDLELVPFKKYIKRKTLIPPIIEKRLSEKIELNRLKQE